MAVFAKCSSSLYPSPGSLLVLFTEKQEMAAICDKKILKAAQESAPPGARSGFSVSERPHSAGGRNGSLSTRGEERGQVRKGEDRKGTGSTP